MTFARLTRVASDVKELTGSASSFICILRLAVTGEGNVGAGQPSHALEKRVPGRVLKMGNWQTPSSWYSCWHSVETPSLRIASHASPQSPCW